MPKTTIVQSRISEELKEKFEQRLKENGISQSEFIINCIMKYTETGLQELPERK